MPTVTISVDCEAAQNGKCYTKELIEVAEEFTVPLTYLLFVSEKDPLSNIDLYYNEYVHKIPAWHEMGMLVSFENSLGYMSDPQGRGDLIRIAKDALKSRHIKPTSFRAHRFDLLPSDLKPLEDCGILVAASTCPGAIDKYGVAQPDGPSQPYHPSYDNLNAEGTAKILMAPLVTCQGLSGDLTHGWERIQTLLDGVLETQEVINLAMSDTVDGAETLRKTLAYCKQRGARFTTLTYLAAQ